MPDTVGKFPSRQERAVLHFVVNEFPFPLALTYARLHEEMDSQEPIAAAWQLRDAFECLLKFTAALALADLLQAQPTPAQASEVAGLLLKPQGLSLGDWHTLLEMALQPSAPDNPLAENGRCLPELRAIFFAPNGKRTSLNRKIDGDGGSFVNWRNRVFGHGVFKQERAWYARETLNWFLESNAPPEPLLRAFGGFIGRLCALSPDERTQLYAALGEAAETVRRLVESQEARP